ncbi:MAG TPA: hypothetical protein VKU19_16315 [Bryobacteraceae bacterium]|nr:hypothetical protein [Bryobacteraceae bacterium]
MPTYEVYVDDNFHYMDEDERYFLGAFTDCASAVRACKTIVDQFLLGEAPARTPSELLKHYKSFGEDPFIRSDDPNCRFSAWTYAETRSRELAGKPES